MRSIEHAATENTCLSQHLLICDTDSLISEIMVNPPLVKRRDASATRAAILFAAHGRFLRESYDSVGLRDIAGDAGVDVALISRYFGGKEGLFDAVLTRDEKSPFKSDISVEILPEFLCQLMLADEETQRGHRMEMFIIMLRSASSPKAGEIIRKHLNSDVLQPLASIIDDDSAEWRANALLALLMGVGVLQTVMKSDGLACKAQDRDTYTQRFRGLFEAILKI